MKRQRIHDTWNDDGDQKIWASTNGLGVLVVRKGVEEERLQVRKARKEKEKGKNEKKREETEREKE